MVNAGIITQARMTSTRLPGKIMLRANGITLLEHHIRRLSWAKIPIYLATTVNKSDDAIAELASQLSIPFYRGDEHNVLQRFYECAETFGLDVIIRVTSDCPLIDGNIIAEGLRDYLNIGDRNVYYSNTLIRRFPRGLDFEIFSFQLLKDAFLHAQTESEKEHVTPYINQNRSGMVTLRHFTNSQDHSDLRWTLDTADDWTLLRCLLEHYRCSDLPYAEILKIVQENPDLKKLNYHIKQKEIDL